MSPELGVTPSGSAWAMKALHPSDALVEIEGIPDKSAIPTVMINYQSTARYGAAEGVTGTWNFAATMLPHPAGFGVATPVSDDGLSLGDFTPFLNQQLSGATHAAKMATFLGQVERWRLAYFGVSIHFDGPALANQGTIACAQVPFAPRSFYLSGYNTGDTVTQALAKLRCTDEMAAGLPAGADFPNFDRLISMPNAYVGEIKEGLYIPLKLTKTCQQWHSNSDLEFWTDQPFSLSAGMCEVNDSVHDVNFPFAGLEGLSMTGGARSGGAPTSPLLNDVVAHVCGRNISVDSAIVLTFRVGIEAQVEPGTILTPYQHISPEYDPSALKAYFMVSRQLKDAYPVSYNDLGKLWSVISAGIKTAAPLLKSVNIGPLNAGQLLSGVGYVGDLIAARKKAPQKKKQIQPSAPNAVVSAATVKKVQEDVKRGARRKLDVQPPPRR